VGQVYKKCKTKTAKKTPKNSVLPETKHIKLCHENHEIMRYVNNLQTFFSIKHSNNN
jgi:hypothetical protein